MKKNLRPPVQSFQQGVDTRCTDEIVKTEATQRVSVVIHPTGAVAHLKRGVVIRRMGNPRHGVNERHRGMKILKVESP